MTCYSPLKGYKSRVVEKTGKRRIVFNSEQGFSDLPVEVPCGQCIGCRLERSRQWAMRCVHEASLYVDNSFITLTYDQDNVPNDFGLDKSHFQDFMKRLRKRIEPRKVRYYHCGEYGEENLRPHYHALLFNYDFADKVKEKEINGYPVYSSEMLNDIWGKGNCLIGDVTFQSAAYVARYVMKKVTGKRAEEERVYERVDPVTGEVFNVIPEYTTMSRRPGIGRNWFDQFKSDVYPSDYLIMNGQKVQPPKYYDGLHPEIEEIKQVRKQRAKKFQDVNSPERLLVREKVKLAQIRHLKRNLDED